MTDRRSVTPRNHLGEPATRTAAQTVERLNAKAQKNRGAANRERIQARIARASV